MPIKAYIKLYKDVRKTPFHSKYRPIFNFVSDKYTSGSITLIYSEKFYPGEEGIVYIQFLSETEEFLGKDFGEGTSFIFGEFPPKNIIGDGIVLEVIPLESYHKILENL